MNRAIILLLLVSTIISCSSDERSGGRMMMSGGAQSESTEMAPPPSEEFAFKNDVTADWTSSNGSAGNGTTTLAASSTRAFNDASTSAPNKVMGRKKKTAQPRKMIWTANLRFQVVDVDTSTKAIQRISDRFGGFISRMDLESSHYRVTNTIQIRISNDRFDELIKAFKNESIHMDELKIHSSAVTEEFIDIRSRLKTKKDVRDRYIDVLRNKTGKVKDIIAAEEVIRKITEEIEAKEGRLRYLQDKVNFSTVTVTIYQVVEYKPKPTIYEKPYVKKLVEGLKHGWFIVTTFILILANIWPLILLIGLGLWKRKWLLRKLRGQ